MARNIFTKGTTITLAWHFTKPDGSSFDLSGYQLRLFYGVGSRYTEVSDFTLGTNAQNSVEDFISWVFAADKQVTAGDYKMKLQVYQNGHLFTTMNYNNAFALYQGTPYSANDEEQEEEAGVVHLYTAAEFYLFNPVVPAVGTDGYWYVNGVPVRDGGNNPIPSYYDVKYDESTRWLSIYKGDPANPGNPDPDPVQVIKDVDDALKHWNEQYLVEEGSLAESQPGNADRWGQYKEQEGRQGVSTAGDNDRWGKYEAAELARQAAYEAAEGTAASSGDDSRWDKYHEAEAVRDVARETAEGDAESVSGDGTRWGAYKSAEGTSDSSDDGSRWDAYHDAENTRDAARLAAEGNSSASAGDANRWGAYRTAENERDAARETAEGSASSEAGDGSRWGAYKTQEGSVSDSDAGDADRWGQYKSAEAARDTARETAEGTASSEAGDGTRWGAYKSAEAAREAAYEAAEGDATAEAGDANRWGQYKAAEAARDSERQSAEGSESGSTADDGTRWGAYKRQEELRSSESGTFDVSLYNKENDELATYARLSAALAAIPSARRAGGMTIRYIDSASGRYVEYRLTADEWSSMASDWQSRNIDDIPTAGSDNLVKSGGVAELFTYNPQTFQGRGINKETGEIYTSSIVSCTPFLQLAEGANIVVSGLTGSVATALALYAEDWSFIEAEQSGSLVTKTWSYLQSIGAKYYRCTFSDEQIANNTATIINAKNITNILNVIKNVETRTILYATIGLQDKKVSLLGDSNYLYNDESHRYGPGSDYITDVRETWWGRFIHATGSVLEVNASLGSSSVTDNEYYHVPGYLDRVDELGEPDVVILGGGMNEPLSVTVGTFNPNKPINELDTMVFADAYDKIIRLLNSYYNNPRIIAVLHPKTRSTLVPTIKEIDQYYGVEIIDLSEVGEEITYIDDVHYNQQGANVIADYMLNQFTLKALGYYTNIDKLNKLDIDAVKEETEITPTEENISSYLVDKNGKIIARLTTAGAIERTVRTTRDIKVDNELELVSSDIPNGGDGIAKFITDLNNRIIGYIRDDGEVYIYKLSAKYLTVENDHSLSTEVLSFVSLVANGCENHKFVTDRTISILKSQKADLYKEGVKITMPATISIQDDDAFDCQLPQSYIAGATESTEPVTANANRGGFASMLYPLLTSLNKKYAATINGQLSCGVCAEGQRIGLTPLYGMDDTFDGTLNLCGKVLKALNVKAGWETICHSMTSRYVTNSFLVEGLDSEFANSLLVASTGYTPVYSGTNGLAYRTTTCYDTVTKKNYKIKSDFSGWDECPVHYAKPYCAISKASNSPLVINPTYSVKYQVKTWVDRCNEAQMPHTNILVGWGQSHTSWHTLEDEKYIDHVICNSSSRTNTIPFFVNPTRNAMEVTPSANGITEHTDEYNVYNRYDYERIKAIIDDCVEKGSWSILRGHVYELMYFNGYSDYFTSLYGADHNSCGPLCYKDDNYPTEWVVPLTHDELQDMAGANTNDYWNNPPARLNISTWDEWYPCPGTTLAMIYDLLEYAISKGVVFSQSKEVLDTYGNIVAIGVEGSRLYTLDARMPESDIVKFFCKIGADNSFTLKTN